MTDEERRDEDLVDELRSLFEYVDAVPPRVVESAVGALSWRRIDAELAELLSDSIDQDQALAGVRGTGAAVRAMTFGSSGLTIDVEIHADEPRPLLLGQLSPHVSARIEIDRADGRTETATETDSLGRFRARLAGRGSIRLRVRAQTGGDARSFETSWITV